MNRSIAPRQICAALALAGAAAVGPAQAEVVLLGSDYLQTVQPSFFTAPGPVVIPVMGLPIGLGTNMGVPVGLGTTDTIVQRQGNCSLILATAGSNCTIPIEMVALSLIGTTNPSIRVRETPGSVIGVSKSSGTMTMTSNGSGTGGTFSSFFDVFVDISLDGGMTFNPFDGDPIAPGIQPKHFTSLNTNWSTIPAGLLINGQVGNQDANNHTNKGANDVDFFLRGVVLEDAGNAIHRAQPAVPEPGSLALVGMALAAIGAMGRFHARRKESTGPA